MIREAKTNKHRLNCWHTKEPAPTNSAENVLSVPNFKLWQQTGSTAAIGKIIDLISKSLAVRNKHGRREIPNSENSSHRILPLTDVHWSSPFSLPPPSPSLLAPCRALSSPPCQSPLSRRLCTAQFSKTPHFTPHPEYSQLSTPIFQHAPQLIQLDPVNSSTSQISF